MLQYLIIPLCDTAVSYCHYENTKSTPRLIPLETLKRGVLFAMQENLSVQFVYPDYALPTEYEVVVESIQHTKIKPIDQADKETDVVVLNNFESLRDAVLYEKQCYVLRTHREELQKHYAIIGERLSQMARLNVVLIDAEQFSDANIEDYKAMLAALFKQVEAIYLAGGSPQLNLLTDRMLLDSMNNCGAGDSSLTLAPNGKFYICPAFYLHDENDAVGSIEEGVALKNKQLYRLDHAPLCRNCDAWHCKRCIYLNRKLTMEVNTPGHQQCVLAHLERNAARDLMLSLREKGSFLPDKEEIKQIDYIDPFDIKEEW